MVMMTFQIQLKNSRKLTQPRIRFDLKMLNDPTVMSAFQTTIDGRFAPLAMLVTNFNKAVMTQQLNFLANNARRGSPGLPLRSLIFVTNDMTWRKKEASQKDPKTIDRLKERSGQKWRWQKRLGYRVSARKWKHASERITARKHTS